MPAAFLPWMVVLATLAAIIASQATITGAFSVTRQAVQLDLLPRLRILQTSAREHSQIFVPIVNAIVLVAVCAAGVGFGSSDALGGTYGAAVAATMAIDDHTCHGAGRFTLALVALADCAELRIAADRRSGVPDQQPGQVLAGRVGAAGAGAPCCSASS